jgi:hypothetical protein
MNKTLKILGLFVIFSLFLGIIPGGAATPYAGEELGSAIIANDEISYWSFDEGTGLTAADSAAAGNNNHGTLINSPMWVSGMSSNALEFSTNSMQYVQAVNNSNSLSIPSGGISITAWIKPDNIQGDKVILTKDKQAISAMGNYFFGMVGGHLEFGFSPQPTGADVWISTIDPVITPNQWSFVAATFTFGTADKPKIYVDGRPVTVGLWQGSGDQANLPNTYPDPLYIGRSIDSGWFFGGTMDEVKLYDKVLTPEEISSGINFTYLPVLTNSN